MPQLHPTRRTGRRLLAGGLLGAVVVLGTPAVASAGPLDQIPGLGGVLAPADGTDVVPADGLPTDGLPEGGAPALPGPDDLAAGAACVAGLVEGIQVQVGEIVGGLSGILVGLTGIGSTTVGTEQSATIPMTPEEFLALLSPEQLASLLAGGQESLTVGIPLVVEGVAGIVPVVFDFVSCLAALVPAPAPAAPATTTPPAAAAPTTTAAPAVTTGAAPAQAVAYPGYAPTGGAPSEDDGSPAALVGLGLLTAATGGGALWLRARRGVAG